MDKYEAAMKLDEIQRLIEKQFYHKALIIIDTLNLNKIKNPSDLNMIVKVFIECEQYENAMELLLRIRKKVNTRRILHQLVHVSIQLRDINNAEKFLKEFKKIAPKDTYQWVFTYQIYRLKGKSITSCIEVLEELKSLDYREQWAYELAKLYHKNGDVQSCINECNDIILWFSEGIFVEKAKLLRAYYLENLDPEELLRQQREESIVRSEAVAVAVETEDSQINEFETTGLETQEEAYESEVEVEVSKEKELETEEVEEETDTYQASESETEEVVEETDIYQANESKTEEVEEETDEDVEDEVETEASQINELETEEAEEKTDTYQANESETEEVEEGTDEDVEDEIETEDSQIKELETEEVEEETDTYQASESETEEVEEGTDEDVEAEVETEASQTNELETEEAVQETDTYQADESVTEEVVEESEEVVKSEVETVTPQSNELETHESEAEVLDIDNHNDMEADNGEELEPEQKPIIENKIIKKLSNLGVDYKAIFDEFLCVEDIQSQIFDSLEQIMVGYTKHNNMIITGDKKSGKSTIGKRMVMLLFQLNICSNTQLAQIDALKINQMDLLKRKDQLMNRCLIIEKAGKLSDKSVHDIMKIIQTSQGKVLFILEDEEEEMNRFLKKHVDFSYVFGIWIHIPKYNEEELFSFVNYFLSFKEFSLSREATLYMKQYISELVQNNEDDRLFLIMEKITMAYHCAKERNKLELRNTTVSKRCKDIDFMTIQKEDFQ